MASFVRDLLPSLHRAFFPEPIPRTDNRLPPNGGSAITPPPGPRVGSYTDAIGSTRVGCGCQVSSLPRGVVVAIPCDKHAAVMVVEMRPRERVGT